MTRTRIINLPFAYRFEGYEPRRRNPAAWTLRSETPVAIPELSDEEAPVALTMIYHDHLSEEDIKEGKQASRTEYRVYGGKSFVPIDDVDGNPISVETFEADIRLPSSSWRRRFFFANRTGGPKWSGDQYPLLPYLKREHYGERNPMQLPSLGDIRGCYKRVHGDDHTAREAEAQQLLGSNLIIVDGKVWTTTLAQEPVWRVVAGRHDGKVEISGHLTGDPLSYVTNFRVDRKADAIAYGKALAEEKGWTFEVQSREAIIHRPDLLYRDETVMIAEQALDGCRFNVTNRFQYEPWPDEAVDVDNHLANIKQRAKDEGSLTRADAIEAIALIERLHAILKDNPPGDRAEEFLEQTQSALRRWRLEARERDPEAAEAVAHAMDGIQADDQIFQGLGF